MHTTTDQTTGIIIKSDRIGRTRFTDEFKREVVAAFESSSLSGPAFARQCGIKYPTFAAWIAARNAARKRGGRKAAAAGPPTFLVAEVAPCPDASALEVHLPGGAIARVSGAEQLRILAALLRQLA
jgi:transposase-like protein